jgi:hypothetical protein
VGVYLPVSQYQAIVRGSTPRATDRRRDLNSYKKLHCACRERPGATSRQRELCAKQRNILTRKEVSE